MRWILKIRSHSTQLGCGGFWSPKGVKHKRLSRVSLSQTTVNSPLNTCLQTVNSPLTSQHVSESSQESPKGVKHKHLSSVLSLKSPSTHTSRHVSAESKQVSVQSLSSPSKQSSISRGSSHRLQYRVCSIETNLCQESFQTSSKRPWTRICITQDVDQKHFSSRTESSLNKDFHTTFTRWLPNVCPYSRDDNVGSCITCIRFWECENKRQDTHSNVNHHNISTNSTPHLQW